MEPGTLKRSKDSILLIEDDEHYANLEKQILEEKFDFKIVVRSGKAEVKKSDIAKAALIIVDFNLPDTTGEELVKEIRQQTDVPILVVTGNRELEIAINTLKTGATDFLMKSPQTLILLPNVVERSIRDYETQNLLKEKELKKERFNAQIETLRQVLTTLAHYINNSTTTIYGYAQLCQQDKSDKDRVEKLIQVSIKETQRITFVLQELENFVNNLELRTTSYLNIPDAMFAIESRINEKIKRFIEEMESKERKERKNQENDEIET